MAYTTDSAAEKNKSDNRLEIEEYLELLVVPVGVEHKNITVSRQVLLKMMSEIPVLFSTKAASPIKVALRLNVAKFRYERRQNASWMLTRGDLSTLLS